MNSGKVHDALRLLQWLIPALAALYAAVDNVFGWGQVAPVETIAAAVVAFIGVVAQHSSTSYFWDKEIVEKGLEEMA